MSDKMIPISFETLLHTLLKEYKERKSFLSVLVKRNTSKDYRSKIGPAAGPHTQLAGNIVASYAAGASHFELKTVQILEGEDLGIVKPCIYSAQEVYNTEWSSELTIKQAQDEYIKAYLLLKILIKEFGLGNEQGFRFIMSVGYDLKGIKSQKVDTFLENMKQASQTKEWKKDIAYVLEHLNQFEHITKDYMDSISPTITDTVTLSTMHGCKSEEIETIATYLIEQKELHTYVKMNPTLLGKDEIRRILDEMGYQHIILEDKTFELDIDFADAIQMLQNLQKVAYEKKRILGVKLTNTLPVVNHQKELMGDTMYLSGAALYPIAIGVVAKIAKEFDKTLPISYSGGADTNNIKEILETGIYPVTVSSVLLKQGGYKNITKMNEQADSIKEKQRIDVKALEELAKKAVSQSQYFKKGRKTFKRLEEYSLLCAKCKNCVDVCPNRANKRLLINQQAYIIHYDNLCNECGNCSFFCIAGHSPYLEKLTVFADKDSYLNSKNEGILIGKESIEYRISNIEDKNIIKRLEEQYEF